MKEEGSHPQRKINCQSCTDRGTSSVVSEAFQLLQGKLWTTNNFREPEKQSMLANYTSKSFRLIDATYYLSLSNSLSLSLSLHLFHLLFHVCAEDNRVASKLCPFGSCLYDGPHWHNERVSLLSSTHNQPVNNWRGFIIIIPGPEFSLRADTVCRNRSAGTDPSMLHVKGVLCICFCDGGFVYICRAWLVYKKYYWYKCNL